MAPLLVETIITYTDHFTSTLFVASWNVMSYFAVFGLLCIVYYYVPTLVHKNICKHSLLLLKTIGQRMKRKKLFQANLSRKVKRRLSVGEEVSRKLNTSVCSYDLILDNSTADDITKIFTYALAATDS